MLAERECTPTSQLRQALAAIKENVDTRVRVCPPASMSTWPIGPKNAHGGRAGALSRRRSKQFVLATFQSVTKKRLKSLLNVAGTADWNVAGTLILAILHVGGGHLGQPFGPARRSGDPSLARKRSPAHLFGYVASAVALAARRRARVPHGHDGLRRSPQQRSRDAHRGVGQHWRHVPSAAALPTSGRRGPPPPACAPPVQPQHPNPHPAPQTAPKPKPKPQRPPKREPKSAPKPSPKKRKRLPGESFSEESSSESSTDSSSASTTDSSAFEEPQPRPSAKEPTKPPRKAPKRAAPPRPKAQPPQPQPKAKPKAREGGGCKYKAGEQVYVVFRDNGQWGIEQGKEALAAGAPPGVGETWIAFPKDPELFAIPRASVWKTKTQAKKFLAKMMAAKEEDKEDDEDGDGGDEGDGPGAGLGATGANRDGGVGEQVEGVEGERMEVEGVEGEGVVGEGVEDEGVVGEGVEGEGVVGEGVVVGEGDGRDSAAGDKSSGAPAGPLTTQDF